MQVTNSKDHLRLDWLLRNGLGPYGYEFVVRADQNDWDAHWRRSIIYANAHGAHVFCCNIYVPNATGHELKRPTLPSPSDKVSFIPVISHEARLLYMWLSLFRSPLWTCFTTPWLPYRRCLTVLMVFYRSHLWTCSTAAPLTSLKSGWIILPNPQKCWNSTDLVCIT